MLKTFTILFFIIFIVIPFTGVALLIIYVIKKAKAKKSNEFLNNEKNEMFLKVRSNKNNLKNWQSTDAENISNFLEFNYLKGISRKFNGYIKSLNNERLISFRRIDRGALKVTTRIVAISSNFEIHYEQVEDELLIEFDGIYFGKIVNNNNIIDQNGKTIGSFNRNQNAADNYIVQINGSNLAFVVKNSDRRTFIKNPFYEFNPAHSYEKELLWNRDIDYSNLMKFYRQSQGNEYNWILAIVIFEAVNYGINFTQ